MPVPMDNHLLATLAVEEYQRLLPSLELVALSLGEVIQESGGQQEYVYFPTTCVVSFLYTMEGDRPWKWA
jgi:hypothetical protein